MSRIAAIALRDLGGFGRFSARGVHTISFKKVGKDGVKHVVESLHKGHLYPRALVSSIKTTPPYYSHPEFYNPNFSKDKLALDLRQNEIDDEQVAQIVEALKTSPIVARISHLDLGQNKITDEGAASVAALLHENTNLLRLSLSSNLLSDESVWLFGRAVSYNIFISQLDLAFNNITKEGRRKLLPYFSINTSLWHNPSDYLYDGEDVKADIESINERNAVIEVALDDYSTMLLARLFRSFDFGIKNPARKFILPEDVIRDIKQRMRTLLKQEVLAGKDNEYMMQMLLHMQKMQFKVRAIKTSTKTEWPSIFGDKDEIAIPANLVGGKEGWKLVVRKTAAALVKEGKEMEHCVAGHDHECCHRDAHIISVVDAEGKSVSTIMLVLDYLRHNIMATKHAAYKDGEPSHECKAVFAWLVDAIDKGKIPVDFKFLEAAKEARNFSGNTLKDVARNVVGFDIYDAQTFRKADKTFRADIIPDDILPKFLELYEGEIDLGDIVIDRKTVFSLARSKHERNIDEMVELTRDVAALILGDKVDDRFSVSLLGVGAGEHIIKILVTSKDPNLIVEKLSKTKLNPQRYDAKVTGGVVLTGTVAQFKELAEYLKPEKKKESSTTVSSALEPSGDVEKSKVKQIKSGPFDGPALTV